MNLIEEALHRTLAVVARASAQPKPVRHRSRLDMLFTALAATTSPELAAAIEDDIWTIWTTCPYDPPATRAVARAIVLLAGRDLESAEEILDDLVVGRPDWAEAWNRRATLHLIMRRDIEALDDIARTLVLEPRHFGALANFAHVCLRHGDPVTARVVLEQVLRLNPHAAAVRSTARLLAERLTPAH